MNQNNNIIGYDSQTGMPIYANQNANVQQPTQSVQQPQINMGYIKQPVQTPPSKKSKIAPVIIAILIVTGIVAAILYFSNQDKKEHVNNEQQNNSSTGNVEDGINTTYDENGPFLLRIELVENVHTRGLVIAGTVQRGKIKVGDSVQIVGLNEKILTTEVTGIEISRKSRNEAIIGDNAGLNLKDITKEQVKVGQVLIQPNSMVVATKVDVDAHFLSKDEGGRKKPFFNGYSPDFNFGYAEVTGKINLPESIEMVNPGENVSFNVELIYPTAIENGSKFSIREDGRTIGTGTITKVY